MVKIIIYKTEECGITIIIPTPDALSTYRVDKLKQITIGL